MFVTEEQVAALRAYLTDNEREYERLVDHLKQTDELDCYSALLGSAFFDAVNRRFAPTGTVVDVIGFVAAVRARYINSPLGCSIRATQSV